MSRKTLLDGRAPALGGALLLLVLGVHAPSHAAELEAPSAPFPPVAQQKKSPPAAVARVLDPSHVNTRVKDVLRRKMTHHGRDAQELFRAATLLQYEQAARAANTLLQEPRLDRSTLGEEAWSALGVPFFTLQDVLRSRASEAFDAAQAKDAYALSQALGRITETCISCHSIYVTPPGATPASAPATR